MDIKPTSTFEPAPLQGRAQAASTRVSALPTPKPLLTATLLFASDLLALGLAALLGALGWTSFNALVRPSVFFQLWPLLAVFPLGYFMMGLYPAAGVNPVDELRRLTFVTTGVYWMVVLVLFLSKDWLIASRGIYVSSWLLALSFVPLGRAILRHFLSNKGWWGVPVIVLGAGKTGLLLIDRLRSNPGLGFKVLACLDDDPSKHGHFADVELTGPLAKANAYADKGVRHALVAMPGLAPLQLSRLTRRYARIFPHLILVPDMFGMASLGVDTMDFAGVVGLHARQNLLLRRNQIAKRCIDLLILVPASLVALPLTGLAIIWIQLVSKGSPFYAQIREGYQGRKIKVWKLRTMYPNADELLERHLKEHPEAREEWEKFYKLKRDPRIYPGAEILRKLSLDELPQLFNVAKGEMSIIGPRPFPYYHLEGFNEAFRDLRIEAKPGITGLWQVSARSDGDLLIQEELDGYYIRNWSPWLDLYILARTPWAVLFSKGAY